MTAEAKLPKGLGPAGRALWRSITGPFEPDERELQILTLACRQVDDVAALEALIARDGMVVEGSRGQLRLNSLVTEARQGRHEIANLLDKLNLPDADDRPMSGQSQRAKRAADIRWARSAEARASRRGPAAS